MTGETQQRLGEPVDEIEVACPLTPDGIDERTPSSAPAA
jgi:hypothetical protein